MRAVAIGSMAWRDVTGTVGKLETRPDFSVLEGLGGAFTKTIVRVAANMIFIDILS